MKKINLRILSFLLLLFIVACNTTKDVTKSTPSTSNEPAPTLVVAATNGTEAPSEADPPTTVSSNENKNESEIIPASGSTSEDGKVGSENKEVKATLSPATEDLNMMNEINLLRKNPAGYIPFIEEYLNYYENERFEGLALERKTAQGLIGSVRLKYVFIWNSDA